MLAQMKPLLTVCYGAAGVSQECILDAVIHKLNLAHFSLLYSFN